MNEEKKYEVIKNLADHPKCNKKRAALTSLTYTFVFLVGTVKAAAGKTKPVSLQCQQGLLHLL